MTRKFDRLVSFDERSREFPIRLLAPGTPRSVLWPCDLWLDQGPEGMCAGAAFTHELAAEPVAVRGLDLDYARQLYFDGQHNDEWAGGAYPGADPWYEGTSILGVAKALRKRGMIESYHFGFGLMDLILGLQVGPPVLGSRWYEMLEQPDGHGVVTLGGMMLGGHAYMCRGVDVERKRFIVRQSRGELHGLRGDILVPYDVMEVLLQEDGEACFPIGRQLTPVTRESGWSRFWKAITGR